MSRIVFLFLAFVLLSATSAWAAIRITPFVGGTFDPGPRALHPQTGQEGILLSFYRNSGKTPNFRNWSTQTEATLEAASYDRRVIALNEEVRLQTAFENTDPGGFLTIHAPLDVTNYSENQEVLFLPTFGHGGMLTQNVYSEKIALVIPELTKFQALVMPNAVAGPFFRALTEDGAKRTISVPVIAEMIVKPRRSIMTKAGRVGKNDHFLFYLDLAELTFWAVKDGGESHRALWTWRAEWYEPKTDNEDLLQLYKAIN